MTFMYTNEVEECNEGKILVGGTGRGRYSGNDTTETGIVQPMVKALQTGNMHPTTDNDCNGGIKPGKRVNGSSSIVGPRGTVISLVVIGAGLIGPRHASHIVKRPDLLLFAIIDHSAKGPKVAQELGTLLFRNLDEMFAYCDTTGSRYPSGAVIATPNHTHIAMGIKLASRGIHLLVEKPLAQNAQDCKTLIDFCKFKGVHLLVGHHRRFNPYIVAIKDNIHKVGQIIAIQGAWALRKPDAYFQEKPWRSSVELGGGTLLINLIHDLDLLQYIVGPIVKVYAELLIKQRTMPDKNYDDLVDEGAALTFRFANGCCGTFFCSDNVTSPFLFEVGTGENPTIPFNDTVNGFYRIFGSHGTLSVPDLALYHQNDQPDRSWLHDVSVKTIKMKHELASFSHEPDSVFGMPSPSPSPDQYDNPIYHEDKTPQEKPQPFDLQLDHFINLINGTETIIKCSGEDALRALLCIEAVSESIKTGQPQFVRSVDDIVANNHIY